MAGAVQGSGVLANIVVPHTTWFDGAGGIGGFVATDNTCRVETVGTIPNTTDGSLTIGFGSLVKARYILHIEAGAAVPTTARITGAGGIGCVSTTVDIS